MRSIGPASHELKSSSPSVDQPTSLNSQLLFKHFDTLADRLGAGARMRELVWHWPAPPQLRRSDLFMATPPPQETSSVGAAANMATTHQFQRFGRPLANDGRYVAPPGSYGAPRRPPLTSARHDPRHVVQALRLTGRHAGGGGKAPGADARPCRSWPSGSPVDQNQHQRSLAALLPGSGLQLAVTL